MNVNRKGTSYRYLLISGGINFIQLVRQIAPSCGHDAVLLKLDWRQKAALSNGHFILEKYGEILYINNVYIK